MSEKGDDSGGGGPGRVVKRSVSIAGHATSISLEQAFWEGLREMAAGQGTSVAAQVAAIDAGRGTANLSSAIRVAVLQWSQGARG